MQPFSQSVVRPRLQAGVSNLQIMIGTLIGGILIMGGIAMIQQIEKAKVDNVVSELSRFRKQTSNLAVQRGSLEGVTLQTAVARDFFDASMLSGAAGSQIVRNAWGGTIDVTPASFNGPWNALNFRYTGVSSSACKQLGMQAGNTAAGIAVMFQWVKTIPAFGGTGAVVLSDLIARCDQGANNVTIEFYLTK